MKKTILSAAIVASISAPYSFAHTSTLVSDESSFRAAMAEASANPQIKSIVFKKNTNISLNAPVIYSGSQSLRLIGNGATIDGTHAGSFVLDTDLTAITEDGTLVFNTANDVIISNLKVVNSATRGIVVNVPADAQGDDISVLLSNVTVSGSALYGVHVDDNANAFDEGNAGSDLGVNLVVIDSTFTANGTGAIDFDGVRVDERGDGGIRAALFNVNVDGNGGDGMELDEAGSGNVEANLINVKLNNNGFYNESDLDDGFDIDEADEGDLEVNLYMVEVHNNLDEGLDFDEAGEGHATINGRRISANNNTGEGIKLDELDDGDAIVRLANSTVNGSKDDGIQISEFGDGAINAALKNVAATNNAKYGIKLDQRFIEEEKIPVEVAGHAVTSNLTLSGNGKGDSVKTTNVTVE